MPIQLSQEVVSLINDKGAFKALATVDESGTPNVVQNDSIYVAENGNIHYLELLETSRTNHNLVRAIWFDRKVSIVVSGADQKSFQIKGKAIEVHITGPLYEKHYVEIRQRLGDVDLSGVWVIQPEEVIDENFTNRKNEEETKRPFFRHLDRLAKV
jgi:predicted pyridoxine 5'-phosphate oxidase superfamily flavin-nucleotide-binding protein